MKPLLKKLLHLDIRWPAVMLRMVRGLYRTGIFVGELLRALYAMLIVKPVMQAIAEGGLRLRIERIPYIRGKGRIAMGDDIYISGLLGVSFLKRETADGGQQITDHTPVLKIGSRSFIGHQCSFALSGSIEIGEDCMIATGTKMQDNDGHPLDPVARRQHERVPIENIRPITIGNNVWIAPRCTILKGVTIGDNAIVGTGSVVTRDVPAHTLAAGVPARAVRRLNGMSEEEA